MAGRDSPLLAGVVAFVVMALFVVVRLVTVADGDIGQFVVAGTSFVDSSATGVPTLSEGGYDGQFSYRLALDPTDLAVDGDGADLDKPYRTQRIGYPALAWLFAGGRRSLVPWSLVLVNVLAVAALAVAAGALARDAGRHALWGLFAAGFWAFPFSVGRDLTEPVAAALTVAALLALRRDRLLLAGLALSGAVLTRETALIVVLGVALSRVRRLSLRPGDAVWLAPVAAFAAWQVICHAATGTYPVTQGSNNVGVPFAGLVAYVPGWVRDAFDYMRNWVRLEQLVLLVVMVARAWRAVTEVPLHERIAWCVAALIAVSLTDAVLVDWAHFRTLAELYVLSAVALVTSRRSLTIPAATLAIVWLSSAALLVKEL